MTAIDLVIITTKLLLNSFLERAGNKYSNKKYLKNLTADDLDLPRGAEIFLYQSLWQYFCNLWSKTKRLQSIGKANSFFVSGGTVKIKIDENSKLLAMTNLDDLAINFPGINLSEPLKAL